MAIELNKTNLSVDMELMSCADGHSIEMNLDTWFDVKEKFGLQLKEDEGLILAAAYDPFADTLKMSYDVGDANDSEQFEYLPTDSEARAIKELITETILSECKLTPQEFCQYAGQDNTFQIGGQT